MRKKALVIVLALATALVIVTPKRAEADILDCIAWYNRDVSAAVLDLNECAGQGWTLYPCAVRYYYALALAETAYGYCVWALPQ